MIAPITIGLVGFGKIARDQHLPAISTLNGAELVAVASRNADAPGVRNYRDLDAMLAAERELAAIAMCQPPQHRFAATRAALLAGKHVFLEKPPGATLSEVEALSALARAQGVTLFASWHSREAAAVQAAKDLLADAQIEAVSVNWKEDVRVWHPGQTWIWEPGGFGVFDPGINALSILTKILPEAVRIVSAELYVPANCAAPIAAELDMATMSGAPVRAEFDFLQTGPQSWDIAVKANGRHILLGNGGNTLTVDGQPQRMGQEQEYASLYRRFAELIANGQRDVDLAPLRLVADTFMIGRSNRVAAFHP